MGKKSAARWVGSLLFFLFMLLPLCVSAQELVVDTDKISYLPGEKINIAVQNKSNGSVYSIAASTTPVFAISHIEKKDSQGGGWTRLPVRCEWPECDIDFDGPVEIKAGQVVHFEWEPRFYAHKQYGALEAGVYRIVLSWQRRNGNDPKGWAWEEASSSEFSVVPR